MVPKQEKFGEVFAEFDTFVKSLAELRKDGESITNFPKIQAMQFAYAAIRKALKASDCQASVTCRQSELAPDMGAVSVEGKEIDIKNMEWFCRAAEFADNTEVYPLKGDKVRMTFTFNGLLNKI